MIRNKIDTLALAFAIVLGLGGAGLLYAQSQQEGTGMMSMMRSCPMMRGMAEGPRAVLEHGDELGLTEAQVETLEGLDDGVDHARTRASEQMRRLHEEIRAATKGERFDEAAVRAAFDRMGELHADMAVAMLRARHDTRRVLTPEQRERLEELTHGGMAMPGMMGNMEGMQGMRGMMQMMENCPMMQGGMEHSPADTSAGVYDEKEDIR